MEIIYGIAVFAGLICLAVVVMTYLNVIFFARAKLQHSNLTISQSDAEWASNNGFEFVGSYYINVHIMRPGILAWRHMDRPTFFCRYQVGNKVSYDLVTEFSNNTSLTTGDTKDGQSLPHRPGVYMQSLSGLDLDGRWARHIESENYLMDQGQAVLEANDTNFEQAIMEAIQLQMKYLRTLSFWPLRGIYWHFVRRYIRHNKTISQQREKGIIRLPNELTDEDLRVMEQL